jgi:hypothetical protein
MTTKNNPRIRQRALFVSWQDAALTCRKRESNDYGRR